MVHVSSCYLQAIECQNALSYASSHSQFFFKYGKILFRNKISILRPKKEKSVFYVTVQTLGLDRVGM